MTDLARQRQAREVVWTFCFLSGLLACGYGVIFTVLDDYHNTYGISEKGLGVVVGIGFLTSFLGQVTIASLADRGHARLLVYLGLAVNALGLVLMGFGESLPALLVGRLIMGLGIGMANPAMRCIVILANRDSIGDSLGKLLAADVTGFAIGPLVSALLVPLLGLRSPFLFIAALSILAGGLAARLRVEETSDAPRERFAFDLLSDRPFAGAVVMATAVFVMIGVFDSLWALVLDEIGASDLVANIGITVFALPMLFLAARGGRMAQRVGPFRVGTFGLLAGAGFMSLYGFMPSGILMVAVALCHSINDGLTVSSTSVAAGMVAPPERQAGAHGLLGGAQTLTGGVAAFAAGFVYEEWGRQVAYLACTGAMTVIVLFGAWLSRSAWGLKDLPGQASA
ncbi:MAG: MFS transporter [Actinomycetota bacterium]|nr:MFS transporter [Actinomycetota bacterium]